MPPHAAPVAEPFRPSLQEAREADPEATLGLTFPTGFVWGAATSAYQGVGAAGGAGRGGPARGTGGREAGRGRAGEPGDVAADHYHRYESDSDLIKSLGLQS